jgi:hypothetical protein
MRRLNGGLLLLFVLAGCSDRAPTDPAQTAATQLSSSSHNSEYFAFLVPVPTGAVAPTGVFHEYAFPVLDVCRVETDGCVPVASTSLTTRSTPNIDLLAVHDFNEYYYGYWRNLDELPRGFYRLSVSARPLNSPGVPLRHLGETTIELVSSGEAALVTSADTLLIKFRVLVGAFCESTENCDEVAFDNATGGEHVFEDAESGGTLGMQFEPGFMCGANQTNCADGRVVVTVHRYRGPERCIPVTYDAIQWESCITIRVEPYGVQVSGVTVGVCIEPRADPYAVSGHLRLLKVREDQAGAVMPGEIVDLNATLTGDYFFECNDEFEGTIEIGASEAAGPWSRVASSAGRLLGRLLTPAPAHAFFHKGPFVASLEDFSRLGPVLPVRAEFDRDGGVGFPDAPLSADASPRARVLATRIPGTTNDDYVLAGDRGVADVAVTFAPAAGPSAVVYTDGDGYASASWTLGPAASNPQLLTAHVGYPDALYPNGDFPNYPTAWASHTFTAYAQEFYAYFLAPLGSTSGGGANVATVQPGVRVCGPLASSATYGPGQPCDAASTLMLPAPALTRDRSAWQTAWKTDKNTKNNSLYRIDVIVNGYPTGGFLLRRGGGGGSDPVGTYQFQTGSNLPIKFTLER